MIRTAVVVAWVVVATFFLGIVVILISFFSKTGNLPHNVASSGDEAFFSSAGCASR